MSNAQALTAAPPPAGHTHAHAAVSAAITHLLCFQSLFAEGRSVAFPCDAHGHIDLNSLSPSGLSNYLFARAMVGRDFERPTCRPA